MTTSHEINAQARDWMSEHLAGMTDSRARAFKDWLALSPEHQKAFAALHSLWDELGWNETLNAEALAMDEVGAESGAMSWFDRVSAAFERFEHWLAGGVAAGVAAAVALMLLMPVLSVPSPGSTDGEAALAHFERHATSIGEIRRIELADGSRVTLGGATEIEVRMRPDGRDIHLVSGGDALFDVARDPQRPFRVDAGRVSATVLGTVFEVNSASAIATVSVLEGRVRVSDAGRQRILGAGERVTSQAGRGWAYETFSADQAARWIDTRLVFRDAPLSRIVEDVNRYVPAGLTLESEDLENLRVTSSFRIDQLESALSGIALSHGLKVEGDASEGFILRREISSQ